MSDAPVTLSHVAREAGVSLATASRAINGSATRSVREDLRERVLETARRLGYSPDPSAQAMARGRTTALGLVVHDIADPYFSTIAAGVARAAEREGLIVTLASTEQRRDRELAFVELARRQRSRAIILAGSRLVPLRDVPEEASAEALAQRQAEDTALESALTAFRDAGGGVATIGQAVGDLPVVEIDNAGGAGALARALHDRGYRRFGVLAGPPGLRTAADRTTGFLDTLDALGCPVPAGSVVPGDFTRDGGYTAMARLLSARADLPQVVFAVNDVMAVGAMAAVREAGLSVPDDVAVAGFDDIHTLRDVSPGLTTVRIPLAEIGSLATALALGRAEGSRAPVHGEVVLRDSTPPR
ncbi:LacI family DNA-binding transcriptional regulator [Promicromonospora thailandica]|uniref:Transcriptional regulator, LacI family n=1 Tax=Promicromonospora thailandica TaxID=765201 RepID=A0A9X2G067_9MICO|nr:LacI family DNA-binding transcriptional regulator [Promicromonospora thailandica]MCP2263600.1 transcriptional regulator, LacI family [Promicromonospora thailandica]BFF19209.1 LacI family DNA-binding transcriptional regulator [Promicromonospora thailandica]